MKLYQYPKSEWSHTHFTKGDVLTMQDASTVVIQSNKHKKYISPTTTIEVKWNGTSKTMTWDQLYELGVASFKIGWRSRFKMRYEYWKSRYKLSSAVAEQMIELYFWSALCGLLVLLCYSLLRDPQASLAITLFTGVILAFGLPWIFTGWMIHFKAKVMPAVETYITERKKLENEYK